MNRDARARPAAPCSWSASSRSTATRRRAIAPSFVEAAPPEQRRAAVPRASCAALRGARRRRSSAGVFRAHMEVELVNDGPVTLLARPVGGAGAGERAVPRSRRCLASASPRRVRAPAPGGRRVHASSTRRVDEEALAGTIASPSRRARCSRSTRRARVGGAAARARVVIGADTVVVLARPRRSASRATPTEALGMLSRLQGRRHEVWTGVAVRGAGRRASAPGRVHAGRRSRAGRRPALVGYVASGEPLDKAGAYGHPGPAGRVRPPARRATTTTWSGCRWPPARAARGVRLTAARRALGRRSWPALATSGIGTALRRRPRG